jgi:hypothetical protein
MLLVSLLASPHACASARCLPSASHARPAAVTLHEPPPTLLACITTALPGTAR